MFLDAGALRSRPGFTVGNRLATAKIENLRVGERPAFPKPFLDLGKTALPVILVLSECRLTNLDCSPNFRASKTQLKFKCRHADLHKSPLEV